MLMCVGQECKPAHVIDAATENAKDDHEEDLDCVDFCDYKNNPFLAGGRTGRAGLPGNRHTHRCLGSRVSDDLSLDALPA